MKLDLRNAAPQFIGGGPAGQYDGRGSIQSSCGSTTKVRPQIGRVANTCSRI
jgi:hypothetical protein